MKFALLLAGLCLVANTEASCSLSSVRLAGALIKVGDSERRVLASGPDRTVVLESRQGGVRGHRHDFYRRGQTVQVHVRGGRVARVCRLRDSME